MDRNTLIGIGLIIAIAIGFQYFTAPSREEQQRWQAQQDSLAHVEIQRQEQLAQQQVAAEPSKQAGVTAKAIDPVVAAIKADTLLNDSARQARIDSLEASGVMERFGIFHPASQGAAEEIVLDNGKVQVSINTHGARPGVIRLKDYTTYTGKPLLLSDPDQGTFEYRFFLGNTDLSTKDLFFTVEKQDSTSVRLKALTTDTTKWLAIDLALDSAGYFLRSTLELNGLENEVDPGNLFFHWELDGLNNEKHLPTERQMSTVYFKYVNDDRDYLSATEDDEKSLDGKTSWVAFKQDFFTVAMVHDAGFASSGSKLSIAALTDSTHNKRFGAKLFFEAGAAAHVVLPMRLYLGPNHYNTLRRTEVPQFDRIIDLGPSIFGWMNRWIVIPIFNFFSRFNLSYGIIILLLTIVIKLLLTPITLRNQRSSVRMRALKPEMDAINEKHKDGDAMKKQQATMELYRKAGVNPAAGCVPLLIQTPILFAMFRFFPSSIELRQQPFLWADDLSSFDSILSWEAQIPLISQYYGNHVSLFTLLMCISTIVYSLVNMKQMPAQQGMPSMKLMVWLFPIMMLFFLNNASSGLSYYYLLANLISIFQMTLFTKWFINEEKVRAELLENMKKPRKKSRWQQRLEDMQKQQGKKKR